MLSSRTPTAIYHAFDTRLSQLTLSHLKTIKSLGFSDIQISPIQECYEYSEWHSKYQPLSYKIGNSLGTEKELIDFIHRAHQAQLFVIADIVFNHLASLKHNQKSITSEQWKAALDSPEMLSQFQKILTDSYAHLFSDYLRVIQPHSQTIFREWNESGWIGGALPQLNTQHPAVRRAQMGFLNRLIELGIDGFRFDGIEHLGVDTLTEYLENIQSASPSFWCYGEIVTTDQKKEKEFSKILPITDYHLLEQLIRAFSFHGSLDQLAQKTTKPIQSSITFSLSHDTFAAKNSQGKHGVHMVFDTDEDRELATLYLLAHPQGIPLILNSEINSTSVQAGLKFRATANRENQNHFQFHDLNSLLHPGASQTFLLLQRGHEAFFILNKSDENLHFETTFLPESIRNSGSFINLENQEFIHFRNKTPSKFTIPKRSGQYYILTA